MTRWKKSWSNKSIPGESPTHPATTTLPSGCTTTPRASPNSSRRPSEYVMTTPPRNAGSSSPALLACAHTAAPSTIDTSATARIRMGPPPSRSATATTSPRRRTTRKSPSDLHPLDVALVDVRIARAASHCRGRGRRAGRRGRGAGPHRVLERRHAELLTPDQLAAEEPDLVREEHVDRREAGRDLGAVAE